MPLDFTQSMRPSLENLYGDYGRLRSAVPSAQPVAYRTVFNDIADEWANCSEDERNFIDSDKEYINANLIYQQQFNAFLLDLVGTQFINSQYGKSAESVLLALRNAKSRYKKDTADNIASVKAENAELQRQIAELQRIVAGGKQ